MKATFQLLLLALVTTAGILLTGCNRTDTEAKGEKTVNERLIGTWHYETITRTPLGAAADTLHQDFNAVPDSAQYYEVYLSDSVMQFYATQADSLLWTFTYNYRVTNDTLYAQREGMPEQTVHLVNVTDSTVHIDYTRVIQDTTYYYTANTRRCELPAGLKTE